MFKSQFTRYISALLLICSGEGLYAADASGSSVLTYSIVAVVSIVILAAILMVSESLLQVESKRLGLETQNEPISIFPTSSFFKDYAKSNNRPATLHHLKKGYNMNISGKIEDDTIHKIHVSRHAVQPKDFRGIAPIPKVMVEEGVSIKAGQPMFYDKSNKDILYVSPVSGEFVALERGEKRSINNLVILADKEISYLQHEIPSLNAPKDELIAFLMETGGFVHINKRPFDVVPNPKELPRDIFISTFSTAPLAPKTSVLVKGYEKEIAKGLEVLKRLTNGKVHLGMNGNDLEDNPTVFSQAEDVDLHYFKGKHPAGNVGIQIHHINPIKSGDVVWTVGVQDLITIGGLFEHGKYIADRTIALTGQSVIKPQYIRTKIGANIGELLQDKVANSTNRIIGGTVLYGKKKTNEAFLDTFANQITVIPEGDYYETFGWLVPQSLRPTVSHTFPNFLLPAISVNTDTNTHGEKRAFVVTGQYEELLPMDIYLQHLMKAILINDFERMEGLGVLELSEEDVALCEFACTSKMPLTNILRDGLDVVRQQM